MMGALAEIQERGDKMVESINNQREILNQLEKTTEEAQKKRLGLEISSRELENERKNLAKEVDKLKSEKTEMINSMKDNEKKLTT